jgi:stress-induced morphogen
MVKQHKLVTQTLKEEIEGIHGLQVREYNTGRPRMTHPLLR